jgi:4-diphosphocytidyl-2-C-methyl-D-erythritol kinase
MVNFPNAKINLGLYITNKRSDGYHDIVSCFYPINWEEPLEIIPSSEFLFTSSGIPVPGTTDTNLVVKAYELIKKNHKIAPVAIHLHKVLPMGAGLGGGSSDAASALMLLNQLFKLNLTTEILLEYSSQLGSDCAFFILNEPCVARGRGELLHPIQLSLKGYFLLLIHPGIHISTQAAYQGVRPRPLEIPIEQIIEQDISKWKDSLINQFEEHLFIEVPALKTIKEKLYAMGAVYASMSGSGSAMFGLFKTKPNEQTWPSNYISKCVELT